MEQLFKYVLGEMSVLAGAPLAFATALVVLGGVIWWIMGLRHADRLASKDGEIALLTRQRDDYREKLGGATPDQAKAKIEELETRVEESIGFRWQPLTKEEIARLAVAVAPLEKRRIQVMYANQLGKALARSIADAFEEGGWKDMHFTEGGGLGVGIGTGRGNGMAIKLKEAIEASTRFKVESFGPNEPDNPGVVFVSVGINPN